MCYNSFGGTVMNCYDFELTDYEKYFLEKNENKFRAKQIFDWLYKKSIQKNPYFVCQSKGLTP